VNDFPKDAEEARIDRDTTRQELTETLEALGHKLNVKERLRESIDGRLDQATGKVADVVSEPAAKKFRTGAEFVRHHPVPVFAALLALLITIRLILRRRQS
jgi:hypothetical protein